MMNYVEFPAEQTAEITKQLNDAGEGAVLRIVLGHTEKADGIKLSARVRSPAQKALTDGECPPDVNKSHTCPPTC